jgi:type VI secretion system secreted protein Hcp
MAGQVFLTVYNRGNAFEHPVVFDKDAPASWVHEFEHQVLYLGDKLFFDRSPIRVHKPVKLLVPVDKITPQLIQLVVQGESVEKVMLRWFQYQEKTKCDTEYFRHLFETVSFEQFRQIMPNVKDPLFDRYEHYLELSFRYKKATWTYMQGNLIVSDEWQSRFNEDDEFDECEDEETDEDTCSEMSEKPVEETAEENTTKVKLSDAKFLPEEGKTDFNKECNVTVNVEYLSKTNRKKVLFRLFSIYNNNPQDMQHETEAFESGGKADARLTLHYNDEYYSDAAKPSGAAVQYFIKVSHPEADEIESERLKLPFKKLQTVQFIEIPDVLFNHNSTVPHIGQNNELINAIVLSYTYANENPKKKLLIRGHTDSSGDDKYNDQLSEMRARVIKALIDKDKKAFLEIASSKDTIEDIQTYLKLFATTMHLDCDPGKIDNSDGPETQYALKNFQSYYNEAFEMSIDVDGRMGPQTWGAVFDIICNDIAVRAGNVCNDGVPPEMNYNGNGIEGCGEKFPIEGKGKNDYKSKTNRRVELTFADEGVVINPPPSSDSPTGDSSSNEPSPDVVLEPIPQPPAPTAKIKNLSYWCSHGDGKRVAKSGEDLEIVPDMTGDKITFKAHVKEDGASIVWNLSGYKKTTLEGVHASASVSGFKSEIQDLFARLLMGDLKNFISPRKVNIVAVDESGKKLWGRLLVYPDTKKTYELDLSKINQRLKSISEKFKKTFDWVGFEVEINSLVGKISASGSYAEDSGSRFVFFAFEVNGGFAPLIGATIKREFPLDGILGSIPKALKKYIYEIKAVFSLKGAIDLKASVVRDAPKDYSGNIGLSGSIGVGVGLHAQLANGKVLDVKAMISSSITATTKGFVKALDNFEKWQMGIQGIKVEWDGLKGELSWELFDGTFGSNQEIVICSAHEIWKTEEQILFGEK